MHSSILVLMAWTASTNLVAARPFEWNGKEAEAIAKVGSVGGAAGYFGTRIYNQGFQNKPSSTDKTSSNKSYRRRKRQSSGETAPTGGQKAADIAGDTLTGVGLASAGWEAAIKIAKAKPKPANPPPLVHDVPTENNDPPEHNAPHEHNPVPANDNGAAHNQTPEPPQQQKVNLNEKIHLPAIPDVGKFNSADFHPHLEGHLV